MTTQERRKCFYCGLTSHGQKPVKKTDNYHLIKREQSIKLPSCLIGKTIKITLAKEEEMVSDRNELKRLRTENSRIRGEFKNRLKYYKKKLEKKKEEDDGKMTRIKLDKKEKTNTQYMSRPVAKKTNTLNKAKLELGELDAHMLGEEAEVRVEEGIIYD